jgi:hypothetical protein
MMDCMHDPDALTQVWRETQANLPAGWALDSLRCASTGLLPRQRSGDWIARAVGPAGARQTHRAADPIAALEGLGAVLRTR